MICSHKDTLMACVYIHPEGSSWYNNGPTNYGIHIFQESLLHIIQELGDVNVGIFMQEPV